jgi:hypothetical protein
VHEVEGCTIAVTVRTMDIEPLVLHLECRLNCIIDQVGRIMVGMNKDDPYQIYLWEQTKMLPAIYNPLCGQRGYLGHQLA